MTMFSLLFYTPCNFFVFIDFLSIVGSQVVPSRDGTVERSIDQFGTMEQCVMLEGDMGTSIWDVISSCYPLGKIMIH